MAEARGARDLLCLDAAAVREAVELARARGLGEGELARALGTLVLLELAAAGSKLTMEDAIELGREVSRAALERVAAAQGRSRSQGGR